MGEVKENEAYEEELLDYEEEDEKAPDSVNGKAAGESVKKGYVGIHSSGFRDFLLKPELLRAIVDSGWTPEQLAVFDEDLSRVDFVFGVPPPNNTWFGFNNCAGAKAASLAVK